MVPGLHQPGLMMLCKAQPNCPALLAGEMVPSTEEGQAKLETSAGLATQAGMNVPGSSWARAEQVLRQVFELTQQVKSNGESEITTGTEPFPLGNAKWPMATFTQQCCLWVWSLITLRFYRKKVTIY